MDLRYIERGTKLTIFEEFQQRAVSSTYDAVYRYQENDKQFVVQCGGLYDNYDRMNLASRLNISFTKEPNTYVVFAKPIERLRSHGMILVEQVDEITTYTPRMYERDELRINVQVYGLPEARLSEAFFDMPDCLPDMSDISFDLSVGGVCVVSNTLLSSKYDPYYLVAFAVSEKNRFLLPARVVRRSNYPRTKIGRYDYGFQFILDKMPDEKGRLSRAILTRKLSR